MKKNNLYLVISIILAVSFIISAVIIANAVNNLSDQVQSFQTIVNQQNEKNVLSLKEAAEYLGVQPSTLEDRIKTTSVGIPYLKLENKYIFTKDGLDKWLETNHIDLDF